MSELAPRQSILEVAAEPVAAASDLSTIIGEVQEDGVVSAASFTPKANITGNDAESRHYAIINKGADGNGTTSVATLDMDTGVSATDFNESAMTLSAVEGALDVAAGDILAFTSTHEGSTGLADPGGLVKVEISRS